MMQHKSRVTPRRAGRDLVRDEARYQMVADDLERRIGSGALATGQRMSSENDLAKTFEVSRVTVRAALAILERKGLIERRPGSGTFVSPPRRLHHDLAVMENLFGQFARRGIRTEKETLDFRWAKVDDESARRLGYAEAMWMSRLWRVDGRPFAITESYLHPATRDVPRAEAERTPAYEMLERLGRHVARADLTVRAAVAGTRFAHALRIDPKLPVLVLQRTSFSDSGEPLESTRCFVRSDAIEFELSVHGSTPAMPTLQSLPAIERRPRRGRPPVRVPTSRTHPKKRGPRA